MHCPTPVFCTDEKVDVAALRSGQTDTLLPLLKQIQSWNEASPEDVTITQCSDAFSNLVYRCQLADVEDPDACVLLRVHAGQHELVNRDQDLFASAMVSSCGLGPRILGLFGNGRIEEFLTEHRSFGASEMLDPALSSSVAKAMATFHFSVTACANNALASGTATPCDLSPILFKRARHWLGLTLKAWGPTESGLPLDDFVKEIDLLEARLRTLHPTTWTAFCHNDLLCGNIMRLTSNSPPSPTPSTPTSPNLRSKPPTTPSPASCRANPIVLIDYEFAGFNPVAFDIANHWCEWAADYHTDQPHMLDYSKYPEAAEQLAFARTYLRQLARLLGAYKGAGGPCWGGSVQCLGVAAIAGCGSTGVGIRCGADEGGLKGSGGLGQAGSGAAPGDWVQGVCLLLGVKEAEEAGGLDDTVLEEAAGKLVNAVNDYRCLAHLLQVLASYIFAKKSTVEFDFLGFAAQHLEQYQVLKSRLLGGD